MSIENMNTLPPNGHDQPAYPDGVERYALELSELRDALDGAAGLARLLRRDSAIASIHCACALDEKDFWQIGLPFRPALRSELEAALCVCVTVAHGHAHELAHVANNKGAAGLARFVDEKARSGGAA